MAGICLSLRNLSKKFGSNWAVDHINLDIVDGEFITLLGPSGSGKTTCLMMVAGLVEPSGGDILLWDERINDLPPHKRGIGVVFQHYALFPHMTVEDNISYPLRMRSTSQSEVEERVDRVLKIIQLKGMKARFPKQLSGGEQQRVALARALVFNPKILLMDEPLGALDRKLRLRLQHEIRDIQRELGVTLMYVTHDQEEAMTMSDRIALMRDGHIEQIDAPQTIYEQPKNHFVASFLGETNFFTGRILASDSQICNLQLDDSALIKASCGHMEEGDQATASVRPEKMHFLRENETSENEVRGLVMGRIFIGEIWEYHVQMQSGQEIKLRLPNAPDEYLPGQKEEVRIGWSIENTLIIESSSDST